MNQLKIHKTPENIARGYCNLSKKGSEHKIYQTFQNKEGYERDTNEENRYTDDSRTGNAYWLKKLDIKLENEEDE